MPAQKGTSPCESEEEGVAAADWLAFLRKTTFKIKTSHFSVANQSSSSESPQHGSIIDEINFSCSQFQ